MNAMRIQQELTAKALEQPRPAGDLAQPHDSRVARTFLAQSLGWELRLAQLRAQANGEATAPADTQRTVTAA